MNRHNLSKIDRQLVKAVDEYDWEAVKHCLKNGAEIDVQNGYALSSAVWQKNLEMVQYLTSSPELTKHADVNCDSNGLVKLCINSFRLAKPVFECLIDKGLSLEGNVEEYLQLATMKKDADVLIFLHQNGLDIGANNNSALRIAAEYSKYATLDYLLKNGADIHVLNDYVLRSSLERDDEKMTYYLLNNGANLEKIKIYGDEALYNKGTILQLKRQLELSLPANEGTVKNKTKI